MSDSYGVEIRLRQVKESRDEEKVAGTGYWQEFGCTLDYAQDNRFEVGQGSLNKSRFAIANISPHQLRS
jgi:hypothetical protein